MENLNYLVMGFQVFLHPNNVFFCFLGVLLGTLVGVLPGLGPVATISLLLPTTFSMNPISAIILLSGIYYGAQYGGSTTSILINMPGEVTSIMTCLDGYQMAKKGRAGPALGIAAFGSFIAGTLGVVGVMFLSPWLGDMALKFSAPEYFALMLVGLILATFLSGKSVTRGFIMTVCGLILGTIGADTETGVLRFTFGSITLIEGLGFIPVIMGLFGIAEVLSNLESDAIPTIYKTSLKGILPSRNDWKRSLSPIFRGGILGFLLGILPGGGGILATFASYSLERKLSKHPEEFGKGAIEGVAAPESANNAASSGAFIPLFTLGIPSNVVMAVLLGALMLQGLQPGPLLVKQHPEIFWGLIASMYVGNVMLLLLNLPLVGLWVQILKVKYTLLFPIILLLCVIGVYSVNNNVVDVFIMLLFGIIGYLMRKVEYPATPLIMALVLGPMLEDNFRQSLQMSNGSFVIFFTHPISLVLILAGMLLILSAFIPIMGLRKAIWGK